MPMLYVSLGGLAVVLALFTLTPHSKVLAALTIALIGVLGFATVPPLQKHVLDQAREAEADQNRDRLLKADFCQGSPPGGPA